MLSLPDPYNTSSQIDLWSFSGCIPCYPLASLWKLVGVPGSVYKCCGDLVIWISTTLVRHTLGSFFETTFHLQGYSKMQIKWVFTASDTDSIVRDGLKRQVKQNQFLIYTNMKYKRSVCLLSTSHFKLHLSRRITSLQILLALTDSFVLGVLSLSRSASNLFLHPSLYPPAPVQPAVCLLCPFHARWQLWKLLKREKKFPCSMGNDPEILYVFFGEKEILKKKIISYILSVWEFNAFFPEEVEKAFTLRCNLTYKP